MISWYGPFLSGNPPTAAKQPSSPLFPQSFFRHLVTDVFLCVIRKEVSMRWPISNGPLVPPVRFSPSPGEAATNKVTIPSAFYSIRWHPHKILGVMPQTFSFLSFRFIYDCTYLVHSIFNFIMFLFHFRYYFFCFCSIFISIFLLYHKHAS